MKTSMGIASKIRSGVRVHNLLDEPKTKTLFSNQLRKVSLTSSGFSHRIPSQKLAYGPSYNVNIRLRDGVSDGVICVIHTMSTVHIFASEIWNHARHSGGHLRADRTVSSTHYEEKILLDDWNLCGGR